MLCKIQFFLSGIISLFPCFVPFPLYLVFNFLRSFSRILNKMNIREVRCDIQIL